MIEQIFAKIILHRIISAVWLTDFLSEIRSLINPRWWGEHLVLSVKRCSCLVLYWYRTHWWSLASCLVLGAVGGVAVWVVQDVLMSGFIPLNVMIDIFLISTRIHSQQDWTRVLAAKQFLHTEVLAECLQENYRHVFLTLIMSYSNKQGPLSLLSMKLWV